MAQREAFVCRDSITARIADRNDLGVKVREAILIHNMLYKNRLLVAQVGSLTQE